MKTSVLVILLFGFGYIAPLSCSKSKTTNTQKKQESMRPVMQNHFALFAPVFIVKENKRIA